MPRDLPAGTITFLFTDIEGSTRLLHELGAEAYAAALADHRRTLREAVSAHGGVEVDTQGDAFFIAFPTATGALAAAAEAQSRLAAGPLRVRMGMHTGTPHLADEGYVGPDVHRAARIAAAGHGDQVLLSAATAALVDGADLRDLGVHRLKDLSAPERLFQLGQADHPPLRTLHQTNLPVPATPFLGRDRELAEVLALLQQAGLRLLTLTGPGGTGKTRLALQSSAAAAAHFPDGVWWVPLAPLRDPTLVVATAGEVLGASDGLAERIGDDRLLLVLDNFEQVVEAAGEMAALLAACRNMRLLVTSREPLRITGEQEYPVPPLAPEEGVRFFLARAMAVRPEMKADEAVVAAICRRLDELPLAIELAAARVRALSPEQILDRLDQRLPLLTGGARDAPERQRTLRGAIAWSFDLLTAGEQRLFARLSVFRGGCTLEAAESVAEADLDTLESLVDKSLLRQRDERYAMLETIREFAEERFRQDPDADGVRRRHHEHYLDLAERAYTERVAGLSRWLPVLRLEQDNLRAALDWARDGDPALEVRLAGAVAPYWLWAGQAREARERVTGALDRYQVHDRHAARARTHLGLMLDDEQEASAALVEALTLWQELGDAAGEALALESIGMNRINFGQYETARTSLEQSLALYRAAGVPEVDQLRALSQLCHCLVATGEIDRAEPTARELYAMGERHHASATIELALHFQADCALLSGDYPEAEERYRAALAAARRSDLTYRLTDELLGVAMSAAGQGQHARAVRLAAAAVLEDEAMGFAPGDNWWTRVQERFIGGARRALTPAEAEAAERAGREVPFESVLDEVLGPEPHMAP